MRAELMALLAASAPGCAQEAVQTVEVDRKQQALVAEDGDCAIDEQEPMAEFIRPAVGMNETVTRRGSLSLILRNNRNQAGSVNLTVYSDSDRGHTESSAGSFELQRGQQRIHVALASSNLATGALDFSGSLTLVARSTFADGASQDASLSLNYHPVEDGWRIYDHVARDSEFDGGALSPAAAAAREEAVARGEEGAVVVAAGGYVRKISDSAEYVPPVEN